MIKPLIHGYKKLISPLIPQRCRFDPTCSSYALEAIKMHGPLKGSLLAAKRIIRCNPWHRCEYHDPVPKAFTWTGLIGYKRKQ